MSLRETTKGSTDAQLAAARRQIVELKDRERKNARVTEVLTRLAALANHGPNAIVEIEPDGRIAYQNNAARERFPSLATLGSKHPLLDGVTDLAETMILNGDRSRTRVVRFDSKTFSQVIVADSGKRQIAVYSDDITEENNALNALEEASWEAEVLAAENALLAEIGRIITSSLDIDDVYEGFAQQVRRLIPFDRIAISIVDLESEIFVNEYVLGVFAEGRERGIRVELEGTMVGHAIERGEAVILQGDIEALSRRFPQMVRSGLNSVVAAPILFQNEVLGVLHLRSRQPEAYTEHHADLVTKVAAQIAPAIANSQLYFQHTLAEAEAKRLARLNAAVAEIGRIITSSLDIQDVYAGFAEQTRLLIPFDRIAIGLVKWETSEFTTAYVIGTEVPHREVRDVTRLVGTFTERVVNQDHAIVFHPVSLEDTERTYPGLAPVYLMGLRSFLSVPLFYKDEVVGVLHFRSYESDAYSDDHVETAEMIGAQIAGAIVNSQLHAETVAADRALQRQTEELERSNADLEQFAYVASHDLQEPLRVIAGYVHLLEERYADRLDEDAMEFIGFAVDATHRMRGLIDGLLDYSRVDSLGSPFQVVDCNRALADAIADLEVSIRDSEAEVTFSPLPTVLGDRVQIAHLLENLIANAIKFRKDDETPRIRVTSSRGKDDWQISVADNGIGIRSRYQDRIFGMFKRAHKRSKYPGTGIGLALCSKIVDRHGGRIWVESEVGEGSTFRFTIPASEEA